jgi:hypothetical protein
MPSKAYRRDREEARKAAYAQDHNPFKEGTRLWKMCEKIRRLRAAMNDLEDEMTAAYCRCDEEQDENDWKADPAQDERWNAGLDFALTQLCKVLKVDPLTVTWDAATETLDGDVQAVIGNVLRVRFGEEWLSGNATR